MEYLKLIAERTGIRFHHEAATQPFSELLESLRKGEGPDLAPLIARTPEREQYISFSGNYLSSPNVIIGRAEDDLIWDISGLAGKTLAVPRSFKVQEQLARQYPDIKLMLLDSDEQALEAVATGQADTYIGNLTVASHMIHDRGLSGLRVVGLGAAITDWSEQQAGGHQGLRVEVHDHAKQMEIDTDLLAVLFRNVRELITNVIKHARAGSLSVWLEQEGNELVITVQDDGVGFDPGDALQGVSSGGGFGLFSIQERMTDLGGRLELASQPGAGCSAILRLSIPALPIPMQHSEIGA